MLKYLSGSVGSAPFGTADMLKIKPYANGSGGHYGNIQFRDGDTYTRCLSCQTEIISRELSEEIGTVYLSGGFNIEYIQQKSGDWLVCFKANNALAAVYMKLEAKEMSKLLAQLEEPK